MICIITGDFMVYIKTLQISKLLKRYIQLIFLLYISNIFIGKETVQEHSWLTPGTNDRGKKQYEN